MFEVQTVSALVLPGSHHNAVLGFYPSFRQVPWSELIKGTNHSLDIAVYYWDKWIKEYETDLLQFLAKPKSQLRLILADDKIPAVFAEIKRLFPKNTDQDLHTKIQNTYQLLQKLAQDQQLSPNKIEVYQLPHVLNYSMQCFDEKILILSFYEMFRETPVDGPAIAIDLEVAPSLKEFYLKELQGMREKGKKIS